MESGELIHAHIVSIWREARKFMTIGGREGMLLLTDAHVCFIHKTEAKKKWWTSIIARQAVRFLRSKDTMIRHDGYGEADLAADLKNEKNVAVSFNDILGIRTQEKVWGSVLELEYMKGGKKEKYAYSVAQDWVKYPVKEPTKFMKVDWAPIVRFIEERRTLKE